LATIVYEDHEKILDRHVEPAFPSFIPKDPVLLAPVVQKILYTVVHCRKYYCTYDYYK